MIQPTLKTCGAWALHVSGIDRLYGAWTGMSREPLVLCYHRVVHDPSRHPASAPAMLVSQRTLEKHLDWIGRRYRFVELDELARSVEEPRRPGRPIAAVTFDDGYADVYHNALPVLERKGIPAAVFVVTDVIGTRELLAHDKLHVMMREANRRFGAAGVVSLLDRHQLARPRRPISGALPPVEVTHLVEVMLATLPRRTVDRLVADLERYVQVPSDVAEKMRALDWRMLARMQAAGVTVGSHTRSHRVLPNEPAADVVDELVGSKRVLEEKLGCRVEHISFPNGHFDAATVRAVRGAGYRYAYTCCFCFHGATDDPALTIPRRTFWERSIVGLRGTASPAIASCHVHGLFDRRHCPHHHGPPSARFSASTEGTLTARRSWASPSQYE